MNKTIEFVKRVVFGKEIHVQLSVELDSLSPVARKLAEMIMTTDKRDDMSVVMLHCKYTNRDLWKRILADETGRYGACEKKYAEKNLKICDMWSAGDKVQYAVYLWDDKRDSETPEQYFERHAEYIRTEKYPYLKDVDIERLLAE